MLPIEGRLSLTPNLPTYTHARAFIRVLSGVSDQVYWHMYNSIKEQTGNPREVVDWSTPDEWIANRLKDEDRQLAFKIWRESNKQVNPRHTRGCWYLVKNHNLLTRNSEGILEITEAGNEFINIPDGEITAQMDRNEGILNTLQLLIEHNPARKKEILPEYAEFCITFTNYQSPFVHGVSLYDRITNLIERGYITRNGIRYEITEAAISYNQKYSGLIIGRVVTTKQSQLQRTILDINNESKHKLFETLSVMDPYKFEHLIKSLLEAMGYSNVEVTSPSGDGGVDVVGDIELGISSIREVVQVKRHTGSITRRILDELRGSLHRFHALRGTIITTGKFAHGARVASLELGGAPITLIDGDKLLDLLMLHEIGLSKKLLEFYEFDKSKLEGFITEEEEEEV